MRFTLQPGVAFAADAGEVMVVDGARAVRYQGRAGAFLARALDALSDGGVGDPADIAVRLGDGTLEPAVRAVMERLAHDRFGTTGETEPVTPHVAVAGTAEQTAAVAGLMPAGWQATTMPFEELFTDDRTYDVRIVWLTDPNAPEVARWNEHALARGLAWLPVDDACPGHAVLGPYIVSGQTPCFECYRRRRAAQHAAGDAWLDVRRSPDGAGHPAVRALVASLAVLHVEAWLSRKDPAISGGVRTVSLSAGVPVTQEYVLRVPRCPACRPLAAARPAAWSDFIKTVDEMRSAQ
jgi:bacteriocin biosynthesis cyclodehydratase domain-containing protein